MSTDLMHATVFYSWQSDLHAKTTRNLMEGCLNNAIRQLGREDDLDVVPSLERDTKELPGSPNILDAILEKIDNCAAFVADVSIINSGDTKRDNPARPAPNPNVLIELGYAVKTCGWDRILPVCNEYYGTIDRLPFDIPDRRVIAYTLSETPTSDEARVAKEKLTATFKSRLKDILKLKRQDIIDIQLAKPDNEELLGHEIDCNLYACIFSDYPNDSFPKYRALGLISSHLNENYYREVADYTRALNLTRQFAFAIVNNSDKSLKSPRLEALIEVHDFAITAYDENLFPDEPSKSFIGSIRVPSIINKYHRANAASVVRRDDRIIVTADLDDIQPKRTAWTTSCYLGSNAPSVILKCRLYADNLSRPFERELVLRFSIEEQSKTLQEWIASGFTATPSTSGIP
ncbi:MAG: hypothetical protein U1D30_06665 [Planctomycetota bacterium]